MLESLAIVVRAASNVSRALTELLVCGDLNKCKINSFNFSFFVIVVFLIGTPSADLERRRGGAAELMPVFVKYQKHGASRVAMANPIG